MPTTHSPDDPSDFWDDFSWIGTWTEDKLLDDDLEMSFGDMSTQDLLDAYDLCVEDDIQAPVDLLVELNTRGYYVRKTP
jgi:hypothetical protein